MNEAVNGIGKFVGSFQRGLHAVQNDLNVAHESIKAGVFKELGFKGGASYIFNNMEDRTKMVAGGILAGGIGLAAWGVHRMYDEDEDRHLNALTSQLPG